MKDFIKSEFFNAIALFTTIRSDNNLIEDTASFAVQIIKALTTGNKILLAGNGGSAADAQHIAGEFVCRLNFERPGLPAFALTTDTSVLTAIGNDYGYEELFRRQVQAVGVKGDVFWGLSTSGRSPNVLSAMEEARRKGLFVAAFTGANGEAMQALADICIKVPSTQTPRIQEAHILLAHIICGLVESHCFPQS